MKNTLKAISVAVLALAGSAAHAVVLTSVGTCSTSDATIGAVNATACLGYYTGSLTNAADFANVIDTLIAGGFAGPYVAYSGPNSLVDPTTFTTSALASTLVIGVHWGGAQGGGHTGFYKWTGLTPATSFTVDFANTNPFLNNGRGGFSNAYLYQSSSSSTSSSSTSSSSTSSSSTSSSSTTSSSSGQVPVPGTLALLGLGLVAAGLRSRKQ